MINCFNACTDKKNSLSHSSFRERDVIVSLVRPRLGRSCRFLSTDFYFVLAFEKSNLKCYVLLMWSIPGLFLNQFPVFSNKQFNFQQINVININLVSIGYWDLNIQPPDYESPPLTNRPMVTSTYVQNYMFGHYSFTFGAIFLLEWSCQEDVAHTLR